MATRPADSSRAHVTFFGGTATEQQAAQDALDERFHDDEEKNDHAMVGHAKIALRREGAGWRIGLALMYPSGVHMGALGIPIPRSGPPRDCSDEVVDALRAANIHVEPPKPNAPPRKNKAIVYAPEIEPRARFFPVADHGIPALTRSRPDGTVVVAGRVSVTLKDGRQLIAYMTDAGRSHPNVLSEVTAALKAAAEEPN